MQISVVVLLVVLRERVFGTFQGFVDLLVGQVDYFLVSVHVERGTGANFLNLAFLSRLPIPVVVLLAPASQEEVELDVQVHGRAFFK